MVATHQSIVVLSMAVVLGGCATPPAHQANNTAQTEVDRQILEASQKIQLAQADLYQAGALNQQTQKPSVPITADQQSVAIAWQGDASQLLKKLSSDRGLTFTAIGMAMPLPVNIDVKDVPYSTVLDLLRAQVGYRARITQQSDSLVLQYNRPQP